MVKKFSADQRRRQRFVVAAGLLLAATLCDRYTAATTTKLSPLREGHFSDGTLSGGGPGIVARDVDDYEYFLPNNSIPTHYAISLRTDIHENVRTFSATTWVYLTILEPTSTLTMHLQELSIQTTVLYRVPNSGGNPIQIDQPTHSVNIATEQVTFRSASQLATGNYALRVVYTGSMRNYQSGYLVSQYRDDDDQWRYVGTTHFQATLARRAFPCYDEPALKATFDLEITHHRTYTAIANMPMAQSTVDSTDPEYMVTSFDRTPRMSTYLVAFAVTDFVTQSNGRHQVTVRANAVDDALYALDVGATILDRLAEYLDVPYYEYMPKITSIAVPDRGTGAMENWGLVTYGEPSLLYNQAVNTYRNRKRVTTVIAHEYAHQWFGDLVSPLWWQYIWLNEGFATLYEYYATRLANPGDEYWELFNGEVIQRSLGEDATETIRPINQNAASQNDVAALFDVIAYQKAGSVLNMFRNVLGETRWQEGLRSYLIEGELSAADENTLSTHLQRTVQGSEGVLPAGTTIHTVLASWTGAPGFPVLNVQRLYRGDGAMILSQERFLADRVLPTTHTWHIPYNYAYESSATFHDLSQFEWMSTRAAKISSSVPDAEWVVFNLQQTGYYRVNYDRRNWDLLVDALLANHVAIHRLNRAQLLDDAFQLARADLLDMGVVLRMMRYLRRERDYAPWFAADKVLKYLYEKLRGTNHEEVFRAFVNDLIEEVYATVVPVDTVTDGETTLFKYLRELITGWGCRIGYEDCLQRSRDALRREYGAGELDPTPVHPDVRAVVYCYGLQAEDTTEEFTAIYQRLMASRNQAERTDLLNALGCSGSSDNIRTLLATVQFSAIPGSSFVYLSEEKGQLFRAITDGGRLPINAMMEVFADATTLQQLIGVVGTDPIVSAINRIAERTNNPEELRQLETMLAAVGPSLSVPGALELATARPQWFSTVEGLIVEQFLERYNTV
ncbi:aminopeptidase N-like [Anopheles bellator]|uniref:aminopeptidase N-like n=1 Tax=Anopheles bellator TaxID=139047 RepID=UPI002649DD5B|nr:aminopeptidase N-like [Anopheles bellator]